MRNKGIEVPRAKETIIKAPVMALKDKDADSWTIEEKAQDKNIVRKPTINGGYLKRLDKGNLAPSICKADTTINMETTTIKEELIIEGKTNDLPMIAKINPRIP